MGKQVSSFRVFDEPSIWKILFHIAPPVMMAQLIQAMYNIVDSFFVGRYSGEGLAALSAIYPVQLIITAIAVGLGVGVNTKISQDFARGKNQEANFTAGAGIILAVLNWLMFLVLCYFFMRPYVELSVSSPASQEYAMIYGRIVSIGSLGMFCESTWSKVHQAAGNMTLPMVAQVMGALTNIVLDPILIFGLWGVPAMGIAGAAIATVAGQFVAAFITITGLHKPPALSEFLDYAKQIYRLGFPSIFMQMLFTVYIVALNIILATFSDVGVTVLGLYYKIQSFFFIPLYALETCIVPLLSYTHAKGQYKRCLKVLWDAMIISAVFMLLGIVCFEGLPKTLLQIFSSDPEVFSIGVPAFRIIGTSFLPAVFSLMMPVFFQALGKGIPSVLLSVTRQLFCLIPIFWGMSFLGLEYTWLAFPLSELITGSLGAYLLYRQIHIWNTQKTATPAQGERSLNMKLITAIISKSDSDRVCQALSKGGFYFTQMATTGGFLRSGNTTVLIGTESEKVHNAMDIIRSNCSKRTETVSATLPQATGSSVNQTNVVVGGATVFVTDVDEFEKM